MGASSSASGGGDYERPEVGNYSARCIQVVELGTQRGSYDNKPTMKEELMLVFELDATMEDGKPFVANWWGTNSLAETANLYKLLVQWRGKAFTPAELERFDLGNLLDVVCSVDLVLNKKGTKVSVGKTGVSSLNKKLTMPERINPLVNFGISDIGSPLWDSLYPWVQKIIEKSDEGISFFGQGAPRNTGQGNGQNEQGDDSVPF